MAIGIFCFLVVSVFCSFLIARFISGVERDVKMLLGFIDIKFDEPEVNRIILFSKQHSLSGRFISTELGVAGIPVEDYFLSDRYIFKKIEDGVNKLGYDIHLEFNGKYLDHVQIIRK